MTDLEYVLLFSFFPLSVVVLVAAVTFITRGDAKPLGDDSNGRDARRG